MSKVKAVRVLASILMMFAMLFAFIPNDVAASPMTSSENSEADSVINPVDGITTLEQGSKGIEEGGNNSDSSEEPVSEGTSTPGEVESTEGSSVNPSSESLGDAEDAVIPETRSITPPIVSYRTHIQNIGWQGSQKNGATSGTTGQTKRLEAMKINLLNKEYSGSVQYRTHVQNIGWQSWVANNALGGTTGEGLRLEAIQIGLTGEIANHYDVYYRVHVQNFGWLGWAKNGESAGTSGYAYRAEAIQIVLVKKGDAAPGSTITPFKEPPKTQTKITTKSYNLTLNQAATIQMSASPQTDTPWSVLSAGIQKGTDIASIVSSRTLTSGLFTRASWAGASQVQVEHFLDQSNFPSGDDSFYQFLVLSSPAGVDATEVNSKILSNVGVLTNKASSFIEAGKQYNINEVYLISHAILETGNGTSQLATGVEYNGTIVYNVYGIGAVDSDPINQGAKKAYEEGWTSVEKAIIGGAKFIGQGYVNSGQDTLYKMRWNPDAMEAYGYAHHQYATDVAWAVKQTTRITQMYRQLDSYNITFEVPQYSKL